METVVVLGIVATATGWALWRVVGKRRPVAGCGSTTGCGGCSCANSPAAQPKPLVQLRR